MKRFKLFLLSAAVGLACAGVNSSGARADILVDAYVYDGLALGTDANSTTLNNILNPGTSPVTHYEFKYSSLNDIVWNGATGGGFLGANLTNGKTTFINGPGLGTEAQFENQPLSLLINGPDGHVNAGVQNTSFFRITGTVNGSAGGGTIDHDDGVTFTVGGQTLVNSPGLTSEDNSVLSSGFNTNGKDTPFELDFVEGNGPPAVLEVRLDGVNLTQAIPEVSTWAMMILGFCGVGFMAYRRKGGPALRLA